MSGHIRWLIVTIVVAVVSIWMVLPDNPGIHLDLNNDGKAEIARTIAIRPGLDLQGGLRVLLAADLPADQITAGDMETARRIVENRVNALGVVEPVIQLQEGANRIVVELPGISDPETAIATIRETGLLEFVDFSGLGDVSHLYGARILTTAQLEQQAARQQAQATTAPGEQQPTATPATPQPENTETTDANAPIVNPRTGQPFVTVMTGAGLQSAIAQVDRLGTEWVVNFTLNERGAEIFGDFTARHIGQPLAIVLDGVVISAPVIRDALTDGGTISGAFTQEEAQQLAVQLRYGALPVPLRVESVESVGPTLGRVSINRSIQAGVLGVITVLAFMLLYYRVPGITADVALLLFGIMNIALFKFIPVTLTLPAITGFLISVGTAVDGNILIFERIKEELRKGRKLNIAVEAGFDRAWTSIRDSNLSTIIICVILYLFGSTFGAGSVRGFAITLALGLVLNLFTAVIVTRTLLILVMQVAGDKLEHRMWWMGI
ncbi:MAG: protein translocase subunit SecD [Anaerolineae bacterium]|nr:protein translocase subunit SecD [Anaerolineae bacterium]